MCVCTANDETGLGVHEGLPSDEAAGRRWMQRLSQLCVAQLIGCPVVAREPCLDQPTEPSRTDPMQFTFLS